MSDDDSSHIGFDVAEHQLAYVYTPPDLIQDSQNRPSKRRKVAKLSVNSESQVRTWPLMQDGLRGGESSQCRTWRHELFNKSWAITDARIQNILNDANEGTLLEVTHFVAERNIEDTRVPTGFIVTGPNIASQGLLFQQLSTRLKLEVNGPVVILKSADSSNLKAVLKLLIRDATNQRSTIDNDEGVSFADGGRKLLPYDLEILHGFVNAHGSHSVVVGFQDSEAFDASLLAELVTLFSSWKDRIPFVLLFGVATSVDLFRERLSRSASRCLYGVQFEVEQTSALLDRIFQSAIAGANTPLRISPALISSLMDRQQDHVQSVQSFIASLKYIYMCHYFFDPLSVLNPVDAVSDPLLPTQSEHMEAVRMLPSFRKLIEGSVGPGATREELLHIRDLLDDNAILFDEVKRHLSSKDIVTAQYLRAIHVVTICSAEPPPKVDLYLAAVEGQLGDSNFVKDLLETMKRMAPEDLIRLLRKIQQSINAGALEMGLGPWADQEPEFVKQIADIEAKVSLLADASSKAGKHLRSSYAIHNKSIRTTVVAQRIQLSYEESALTSEDKAFTTIVDDLAQILREYLTIGNSANTFLSEIWTADCKKAYQDAFSPRPRAAIERALTAPYVDLNCTCCEPGEGLSSTHPATATLYQLYLETEALINVHDLWAAFYQILSGGDEERIEDRDALVLFYSSLADLKALGMVKPSKKKADHVAKVAWKGL